MSVRLSSRVITALAGLLFAANVGFAQVDDGASSGSSTPAIQERGLVVVASTTRATPPEEPPRGEPPRRRGPGQGRGGPAAGGASELWGPTLAKSDAEKKALAVLKEMKDDRALQFRNVSEQDGRLMRQLTEAIGAKRVTPDPV